MSAHGGRRSETKGAVTVINMSNELNIESFNSFLDWLDQDRDKAAQKYEALRAYLICFLNRRQCLESERLADDALNIFIRNLPRLRDKTSDPRPYLTTVARNLFIDYLTTRHLPLPPDVACLFPVEGEDDGEGQIFESLDECLQELSDADRELFLKYYARERQEKIDFRIELAAELGISRNALRLKIYHIKARLRCCINDRLSQAPGEIDRGPSP